MWVRQCDLDAHAEAPSPIPTRIASNEEFLPPPQSPRQKQFEARLKDISARAARRQGLSRRDFLRTGSGMAAALVALNQVFGPCYEVEAAEVEDQQAFKEKWPKDEFIFDVQTHHVDVSRKWYDDTPDGRRAVRFFQMLRPFSGSLEKSLELLNRAHYVKEVFGDSDTVMAIISGVPSREWDKNPLPPDQMVETRRFVNDLAGSRRVLSHGLLRPNLGARELDEMERQVKDLKIEAWKMYTGAELGERAWFLDDEKVAYPFWEKTRAPGLKNIYFELGGTFSMTSSFAPTVCMHMLGQMLQVAGADHILWGTDSIWGGSPQSQIVRMRRLKIRDDLIDKYKYPQLTDEVKDQVFGLNAAR